MQFLGSDVTLPIFEQEPLQSQTLACWPDIHRPQALQHVRWGRHHIHITNIGRVMAEINNYVAAGGRRSVNALPPQPGPDLRTIWCIRDRLTNVATRLPAFSSDKAPPGCLLPPASHRVRNILSRPPKQQALAL